MVARIKRILLSRARSLISKFARAMVDSLPDDVRKGLLLHGFGLWLREDPENAIDMLMEKLSIAHIPATQCDKLVMRGCKGLNATSISDACMEALEAASGGKIYYSQEGEDIILARYFGNRADGFFVDIGAHHATRFSNTFALYRRGWRGINIDATPGSMESFRTLRPDDTNLEIAISDKEGPLVLNVFGEGALNTFDPTLSDTYASDGYEKMEMVELYPRSLADVLNQYLAAGQSIDLMTVDVEGEDIGVLRSNDWEKYSPEVIIIEALDTPLPMLQDHPAITLLAGHGFVLVSRLYNSVILRRELATCVES